MLKDMIVRFARGPGNSLSFQPLWQFLHLVSLTGMNMGTGSGIASSGEAQVINKIGRLYPGKQSLTIFDVGANVGEWSQTAVNGFGRRGTIYAFEPSKETFRALNIRFEDISKVKCCNLALGSRNEIRTLFYDKQKSGLASFTKRRLDHFGMDMSVQEDVRVTTLDNFVFENKIAEIHLLKIDVEGHELEVLEGAKESIRNGAIKAIQFEFGGCNIDTRIFFQDFYYVLKDHFRLFRILRKGLYPIKSYSESHEVLMYSNFLAITKEMTCLGSLSCGKA